MVTLTLIIVVNLIVPSLSADVRCELAFECANSTTNARNGPSAIYIYGYKSHTGSLSTLHTDEALSCVAAFGCYEASSITAEGDIWCSASNACTKSPYIHSDTTVYGNGVNALTSANISTTPTTKCNAEQSCAYSIIKGSTLIEAYGAYSLLNAVIDSINGVGTLDINLFGYYSGFGSNITCRTGDSCTINCASNGCANVHLNCDNNCVVTYTTPDTVRAINHSWIDIGSILLYDTANITNTFDKQCSAQPDNMNYDDYLEVAGGNITASSGGPLCCRGYQSCAYAINIDYTSPIGETIVASGDGSFYDVNIKSNGDIFCDAHYSCDRGTISTTGIVYCTAHRSCFNSDKITAPSVYCSGDLGCYSSSFLSDGNDMDIYLLGHRSGYTSDITCSASDTCSIWCYGYNSCESMSLVCDGICNLYCDADSLCPDGWNATVERPTTLTTGPTTGETTITSITPSLHPTVFPSSMPSKYPTTIPSLMPSTDPTLFPSFISPSDSTTSPSLMVSKNPTSFPSSYTSKTTTLQSSMASKYPTVFPSSTPSTDPTSFPSLTPPTDPTSFPSSIPSKHPTELPALIPSTNPTVVMFSTLMSSMNPTAAPSLTHSIVPTVDHSVKNTQNTTSLQTPASQMINITLSLEDDVSLIRVIEVLNNTLIEHLIAAGVPYSLQTDIIEKDDGSAIITAYITWAELDTEPINEHEMEGAIRDDLDGEFEDDVDIIKIDIINNIRKEPLKKSNHTLTIILSISGAVLCVGIGIIIWFCRRKRKQQQKYNESIQNMAKQVEVTDNKDTNNTNTEDNTNDNITNIECGPEFQTNITDEKLDIFNESGEASQESDNEGIEMTSVGGTAKGIKRIKHITDNNVSCSVDLWSNDHNENEETVTEGATSDGTTKGIKRIRRRVLHNNDNESCSVDLWSNDHNGNDVITSGATETGGTTTTGERMKRRRNLRLDTLALRDNDSCSVDLWSNEVIDDKTSGGTTTGGATKGTKRKRNPVLYDNDSYSADLWSNEVIEDKTDGGTTKGDEFEENRKNEAK